MALVASSRKTSVRDELALKKKKIIIIMLGARWMMYFLLYNRLGYLVGQPQRDTPDERSKIYIWNMKL